MPVEVSKELPTATQSAAPTHETLDNELLDPASSGVFAICQSVPFHSSASVKLGFSSRLWPQSPTDVRALADTHETPFNSSVFDPLGAGTR